MSAATQDAPTTTLRGTPLARSWDESWIAHVEAREDELDRRICGARTIGHAPCPASSDHPTGRCGHHGGFALTGAPEGNRNAAVHMLYARRLMPCGSHCPNWSACPLGGGAPDHGAEMLKRKDVDRPTCPFELMEYNAVVTDAQRRTQNHHANAWGIHVAHQVALMTVLTGRAARALATRPFIDKAESYQAEHLILTDRPSAALIAYEKLARELRRWTILLERGYEWISCDDETAAHHSQRQATDTATDPDSLFKTATGQQHLTPEEVARAQERATEMARKEEEEHEKGMQRLRDMFYAARAARDGNQADPFRASPTPSNGSPKNPP
jgi:hypothetical protein